MNNRQRRGKQVFVHEVTLACHEGQRYFEYDRRIELAKQWLQWNSKRKNYTLGPAGHASQTFKFRSGALAALFALKWL